MSEEFRKISVVGLGYIGLPTAAVLAMNRQTVIGIDIDLSIVDTINEGKIHINEPHLAGIVEKAVSEGYMRAAILPESADCFLICVPTPFVKNESNTPEPDISYVQSAIKLISPVLEKGNLIILESTCPVGTTEKLTEWIQDLRPDLKISNSDGLQTDIHIAYCPERVLPGKIISELVENDRVIGGLSQDCSEKAVRLYNTFVKGECIITNASTAEMVKLSENAFRDVQLAFSNEISIICDEWGINVWELISLANRHPRVNMLQPGSGVGGHCIPVDPWFIINKTSNARLLRKAREINNYKPDWIVEKVKTTVDEFIKNNPNKSSKNIIIACYGLAFKANVDDFRESPALDIVRKISKNHQGSVLAIEPNLKNDNVFIEEEFEIVSFPVAAKKADIHVCLVDHDCFKLKNVTDVVKENVRIDILGIWP